MQPDEFFDNPDLLGLTVTTSEFAVATSDGADRATHDQISVLLRRVREQLQMDVAFVAEFVDERRVFRHVDARTDIDAPLRAGHSDPLEETYCQRIVDGRLPFAIHDTSHFPEASILEVTQRLNIGAYLSAPVVLSDGRVYGTVCCINHAAMPALGELEVQALRSVAETVSAQLEAGGCTATRE